MLEITSTHETIILREYKECVSASYFKARVYKAGISPAIVFTI